MHINKISIKNWSIDDRPREKLISKGINSLSDAEIIAILIGSGNKKLSAVDLAKQILNDLENNLDELAKLNINDLIKYNGIGQAKAISIIAALEIGKRRSLSAVKHRNKINCSKDVFLLMAPMLCDIKHEEFWIVLLNQANKIISKHKISQGGISMVSIDIRIIMKIAIENYASRLILVHNHPSASREPSPEDHKLTEKIYSAGKILNINVTDHIIIANNTYYSFADEHKIFNQ